MHYRLFYSSDKWLTAADLYDADRDETFERTLTVAKVTKGELVGDKGRKSIKLVLHWEEANVKPLGCAVEISQAMLQITGQENPKNWKGARITLFVKMIDMRGEGRRPAIRVKAFNPNQQRAASHQQSKPQQRAAQQSRTAAAPPADRPPPAEPPPDARNLTDEEKRLEAEYERFKSGNNGGV